MNAKRERAPIRKSSLENEIILSVVILYVLISAALLLIHYLQPPGVATVTSSTSPAHEHFSGAATQEWDVPAATGLGKSEVEDLLTRLGYREIRDLQRTGGAYRAVALNAGKAWLVEVDAKTLLIAARPAPAR